MSRSRRIFLLYPRNGDFQAHLLDSNHVHILTHLQGVENPLPPITVPLLLHTPVSDENVNFGPTCLLVPGEDAMFGTRAMIVNPRDRGKFRSGAKIKVKQNSPCVVTIRYTDSSHLFRFPFPVSDRSPLLRVSKKGGWIELVGRLSDKRGEFEGGCQLMNIFPMVHSPVHDPSSWNVPSSILTPSSLVITTRLPRHTSVSVSASV